MVITNVKIINHDEVIKNADVHIEGRLIKKIVKKPGDGKLILVPGFIDTHIHGCGGFDTMDGGEALEKISQTLAKNGTTGFFPTPMTAPWEKIIENVKEIANAKVTGSKILGIHAEGPFISIEKKGAHPEEYIIVPTTKKINQLIKAAAGRLKKVTIAPELLTKPIAKLFHDKEVVMTLGHGNATAKQTKIAIKNGATSATHLWNAMTGIVNRKPGMVEALMIDDHIYTELITDLVHVDEEAIALTMKTVTKDRVIIISDSIRPAGLPNGDYVAGGLDVEKFGNKITLKGTNTIAGSGTTMHDNFVTMLELGYNIKDVVKMTSYNAAKTLKLGKTGYIIGSYAADLVLLDPKEYNIKKVFIDGKEI